MKVQPGHIINSSKWDTVFDQKDKAAELQQRLSAWSRTSMPRELAGLFDDVCPAEQTWRIATMEIDLGVLELDGLEEQLTAKLRKSVSEKITSLILNEQRGGGALIVLDENTSATEFLRNFLLKGLLPWSFTTDGKTVNELIAYQLRVNFSNTISMIRATGSTSENVRRRISWQVSEPNIITIITGLEPNNYGHIIAFANEIVKIQAAKPVVQADSKELKKQVWLWIFNYLLNERGSIFNRIQFMKSSIKQMAAHYNLSYQELFMLIENAVNEIKQMRSTKSGFAYELNVLSAEHKHLQKKEKANNLKRKFSNLPVIVATEHPDVQISSAAGLTATKDHWLIFKNYLSNPSKLSSRVFKGEFNDLVNALYREDKYKFRELIVSAGYDHSIWPRVLKACNQESYNMLFLVISPAYGQLVITNLAFLAGLLPLANVKPEISREAGLLYLLDSNGRSYDAKNFVRFYVNKISKATGINEAQLIRKITLGEIAAADRTYENIGAFQSLGPALSDAVSQNSAFFTRLIHELLSKLNSLLNTSKVNSVQFNSSRKLLLTQINRQPGLTLVAMIDYHDPAIVGRLLPLLLDDYSIRLLVSSASLDIIRMLSAFERAQQQVGINSSAAGDLGFFKDRLYITALQALVKGQGQTAREVLEFIWNSFTNTTASTSALHEQLFKRLAGNSSLEIKATLEALNQQRANFQQKSLTEQVSVLMSRSSDNPAYIGALLLALFTDPKFVQMRSQKDLFTRSILNYMTPDGAKLLDTQVGAYLHLIKQAGKPQSKVSGLLDDLFWKCLLDYHAHYGDREKLKANFEAAVHFNFELPGRLMPKAIPAIKKIMLKDGKIMSITKLAATIKNIFSTKYLTTNKNQTDLAEMIVAILEFQPLVFREIIGDKLLSKNGSALIQSSLTFNQCCLWLFNDGDAAAKEAADTLKDLYNLVEVAYSAPLPDSLTALFWRQLIKLSRTARLPGAELKQLLAASLQIIFKNGGSPVEQMVATIGSGNNLVTPILARVFAAYSPVFAALFTTDTLHDRNDYLNTLARKGVLYPITRYLILNSRLPSWYLAANKEPKEFIRALLNHHSLEVLLVLRNEFIPAPQLQWLHDTAGFGGFTGAIGKLDRGRVTLLAMLEKLHSALGYISLPGITARELQHLLFLKVVKAWKTGEWKELTAENIWNQFIWIVCVTRNLSEAILVQKLGEIKHRFPLSLQVSLENTRQRHPGRGIADHTSVVHKPSVRTTELKRPADEKAGAIAICNAGLVLVNAYIPLLFERLGILKDGQFTNTIAQLDAVHYLQYVATGLTSTEEHQLPLNKILCGLPTGIAIKDEIELQPEQVTLIEELIGAMISYWPVIGQTSIDGFRGNWLVRDGLLREYDDRWELHVQKRSYDLLLHQSALTFSTVKLPWMEKPLNVNWT